jgi:hypothetical protein
MPFPERIVKQAWQRSGGKCECTRQSHDHIGRCNKRLLEMYRGESATPYGWEVNSKSGNYLNDAADCEICCWDCRSDIHYL